MGEVKKGEEVEHGVYHKSQNAALSAYLLIAGLTVHAIFAGIVIGLENSMGPLVNIVTGILAHKWAATMAIGVALNKSELSNKVMYLLIAAFSITTPIGICIGIGIDSAANPLIQGIFFSIATGTFLYIAASEVIVEEFSTPDYKMEKFAAFIAGVTIISLLMIYVH
jgi:zinc transporter 1/2/3